MIKDTLQKKKPLQDSDKIVESLIALRDELHSKITNQPNQQDCDRRMAFFKINSCLYSEYPAKRKQ